MTQRCHEVWDRVFKKSKRIVTSYINDPMPTVLISYLGKNRKKPGITFVFRRISAVYELFRVGVGKTSNPSY
jgi:hypothetical protein